MLGHWDLKAYLQKGVSYAADGDFLKYEPRKYPDEERAMRGWTGGHIDYIPQSRPVAMAPLPAILQKMLESYWRQARPSAGATRGPIMAGGHRTPPPVQPPRPGMPRMPPLPLTPGSRPYVSNQAPAIDNNASVIQLAPHISTAFAQDWDKQKEIPRVNAFAFRGDRREPNAIKLAGGFQPPITRTDDHYVKTVVFPMFKAYFKARAGIDVDQAEFLKVMAATNFYYFNH